MQSKKGSKKVYERTRNEFKELAIIIEEELKCNRVKDAIKARLTAGIKDGSRVDGLDLR